MQNSPQFIPMGLAVWGLPAEPEFSLCADQIAEFTKSFGGTAYVPHVTVYSGKYPSGLLPEGSVDALNAVLKDRASLSLPVQALKFGNRYHKQCYLQLEDPNRVLQKLSDSQKSDIARRVRMPEKFTLSSLSLVLTPSGLLRQEDVVPAWQTLFETPLSGGRT